MFNSFLPDTLFVGHKIIYLPTCHSTNDFALNILAKEDVPEGTIVITDNQMAGKGQRGNKWETEPGKNLTLSLVLNPCFLAMDAQFSLNIFTSLAVYETLTHFSDKKVSIKWPNDIYCDNKKICGILIQNIIKGTRFSRSIVGIGLNINQIDFEEKKATSLALLEDCVFDRLSVFSVLLRKLEFFYLQLKNAEYTSLKSRYLSVLYRLNEEHLFQDQNTTKFKGIIREVENSGKIVLEVNGKFRSFYFKELSFIF